MPTHYEDQPHLGTERQTMPGIEPAPEEHPISQNWGLLVQARGQQGPAQPVTPTQPAAAPQEADMQGDPGTAPGMGGATPLDALTQERNRLAQQGLLGGQRHTPRDQQPDRRQFLPAHQFGIEAEPQDREDQGYGSMMGERFVRGPAQRRGRYRRRYGSPPLCAHPGTRRRELLVDRRKPYHTTLGAGGETLSRR